MIPASYLFKQVYHQHWEAAEPETPPPAAEPRGGMTIPLLRIVTLAAHVVGNLRHRRHGAPIHGAH